MPDCFRCEGMVSPKLKTHVVALSQCAIIIKNVPAFVCEQCCETYFSDDVMQNLECIVEKLKNVITEVAVVNYADNAA